MALLIFFDPRMEKLDEYFGFRDEKRNSRHLLSPNLVNLPQMILLILYEKNCVSYFPGV